MPSSRATMLLRSLSVSSTTACDENHAWTNSGNRVTRLSSRWRRSWFSLAINIVRMQTWPQAWDLDGSSMDAGSCGNNARYPRHRTRFLWSWALPRFSSSSASMDRWHLTHNAWDGSICRDASCAASSTQSGGLKSNTWPSSLGPPLRVLASSRFWRSVVT